MSIDQDDQIRVLAYIQDVTDPRDADRTLHPLSNIILLALIGVLGGADNWAQIEVFAKHNEDWLSELLPLEHGVPSHDTFGRVFRMLDPVELSARLGRWLDALHDGSSGEHIAVDGKTLRRSFDRAEAKSSLHVLNAWATRSRVALGAVPVEDKENEIVAIPRLLGLLDLKGNLVSIDAISCQKAIAEQIVEAEGDYILQLKANQPALFEEMQTFFLDAEKDGFPKPKPKEGIGADWYTYEETSGGHGRVEVRRTWATEDLDWFADKAVWPGLRTLVVQRNSRFIAVDGKESEGLRMFISSRPAEDVEQLARAARAHWQVENQLHWVLDVVFLEDQSRVRRDNAPLNLAALRRLALSLIKRDTSRKASLTMKRKIASWNREYLIQLLAGG